MYLQSWTFILLLFCKGDVCGGRCEDTRVIVGAEKGNITLQINKTGMKEIMWFYEQAIIGTMQNNGPITVQNDNFKQRVYSGSAGSLIITELTKKDQGTYSANGGGKCIGFYLQVFKSLSAEDIQIHHKINDQENCSLTLYCNGTGSFWENRDADGIMGNNTLHVIYANASSSYTCTAQNQISRVSRSIIPWTLCRENNGESNETRPETQHIRTTIAVSVPCFIIIPAIIALYLWVRHGHQLDPDTTREEPIIYAQVAVKEMDKKEPFQYRRPETVYVLLAADCPNEAEETAPQD